MLDRRTVGETIKAARLRAKLSVSRLAAEAHVERHWLSAVERGMVPAASARASVQAVLHALSIRLEGADEPDTVDDEAHA